MVAGDPTIRYAGLRLEAIAREERSGRRPRCLTGEDQGIELADRVAVLDSAWRLIPADVAKAPLEAWQQKSPPPATGCGKGRAAKVATVADDDEDDD